MTLSRLDDDAPWIPPPDTPGRRGAVAIIVREDGRMLVIRRSSSVVAPLTVCFPGGGIEAGESEEEALVREVREELGVTVRPLRRLWQCVTAWKVQLAWWLAELPPEAMLVPNPAEVDSIHWLTPAEMAAMPGLLESNRELLELVQRGEIDLRAHENGLPETGASGRPPMASF